MNKYIYKFYHNYYRIKRLSLFKKKYKNIINYKKAFNKNEEKVKNYPLEIYFEVSSRCNQKCIICPKYYYPQNNIESGNMTETVFNKAKTYLKYSFKTYLFGHGEPLLNKHFVYFLNQVKKYDNETQFYTNGILLNKEKMIKIILYHTDIVWFSLNAIKEETYNKIHKQGTLEKILSIIDKLIFYKNKMRADTPEIGLNYVINKLNYKEISDFFDYFIKKDIKYLNFSPLTSFNEETEKLVKYYETEKEKDIFEYIKQTSAEKKIVLNAYNYLNYNVVGKAQDNTRTTEESKGIFFRCYHPFRTMYIDFQGNVRPCCFSKDYYMGNLNEQSFEEIWRGEKYKELRKYFFEKRIHPMCEFCLENNLVSKREEIFEFFNKRYLKIIKLFNLDLI